MTINTSNTAILTKSSKPEVATNPVTGKTYFGQLGEDLLNAAHLKGYSSNEWATLKKWNSIGETIAKGERGTVLLRTPKGQTPESENPEPPVKFFLYNRCQLASFVAKDTGDQTF